jgi:hypothetical protein
VIEQSVGQIMPPVGREAEAREEQGFSPALRVIEGEQITHDFFAFDRCPTGIG